MKFSRFLDNIFYSAICFVFLTTILNYNRVKGGIKYILPLIFSICVLLILFAYSIRKEKSQSVKKKDEILYNKILNQLKANKTKQNIAFFSELFKKNGIQTEIRANYIMQKTQKRVFFPNYEFEKLTKQEVTNIYKLCPKSYDLVILCDEIEEDTKKFVKIFGQKILFLPFLKVFEMMKKVDFYPEITILEVKKKFTMPQLYEIFNPKKSKRFLSVGFIMLCFSYFVFYPIYYIVMGFISVLLGIICRFFGKNKPLKRLDEFSFD